MLCCFLIALAATPAGAFLIGPSSPACCSGRAWFLPSVQAFGLALAAALSAWVALWLLLPGFGAFHPFCRALLASAI